MTYIQEEIGKKAAGMGMAFAVNGSIIVAIMLSPMIIEPRSKPDRTTVHQIPLTPKTMPPDTPIEQEHDPITAIEPIFVPKKPFTLPPESPQPTTTETDIGKPNSPGGADRFGKSEGEIITREETEVIPKPVFIGAKRDPKYASRFQPDYPAGLLVKEIEGDAVIKVLIGTDGRVREAIVVRATHADFGKAAVKKALNSWRFIPATRDGKPVEDWQTIPIRFTINA